MKSKNSTVQQDPGWGVVKEGSYVNQSRTEFKFLKTIEVLLRAVPRAVPMMVTKPPNPGVGDTLVALYHTSTYILTYV